jgi:phosphoenolpyruvate synthase/pyruvate phosphate dikinase
LVQLAADQYLVWLHEERAERALVGGKGASLSHLAALSAPVPIAFALTTHVYRTFAELVGVPLRASCVNDADLAGIRARIVDARMSETQRELLCSGFSHLQSKHDGPISLAVRSSATAEDSVEFSFAGLHDTVLDVRDLDHLEEAVKQCWASLWSERAVAYRRAGGIDADEAAIAVVVQQLIPSDVSFVVFTVDQVSEREEHTTIAATWGLGEAVVSGLVVPDHIVIGPTGEVIEYLVGDKHLMVIPGGTPGGGSREVPVPRSLRTIPVLNTEQACEIGRMARDLSRRLGFRADLEGAIAQGSIYFFQARPITTLRQLDH